MKSRPGTVVLSGFALAITAIAAATAAGTAYAGAGGSGCIYGGGHLAELDGQKPLVQADADDLKINPKWLELLDETEGSYADNPAPAVVHN